MSDQTETPSASGDAQHPSLAETVRLSLAQQAEIRDAEERARLIAETFSKLTPRPAKDGDESKDE